MLNYEVRNKKVTLILCIFLGYMGIHHFYNKKTKKGILYLFTYGMFFVGWIHDIIKIINQIDFNAQSKEIYCVKCGNCINTNKYLCSDCQQKSINVITKENNLNYDTTISLYKRTKINNYVNDYIIFDFETTGYDPNRNEIIEIGALKYKNNELIDSFHYLINPQTKIPKRIIELTKITDEMVMNEKTLSEIFPIFLEWIEDYTLIAHNGSFDLGFIEAKIKQMNLNMINNKNIDTLYIARKNITKVENHKLETLKNHFKLDYSSHRALEDCYVTNYVYQYCKNNEEKSNN